MIHKMNLIENKQPSKVLKYIREQVSKNYDELSEELGFDWEKAENNEIIISEEQARDVQRNFKGVEIVMEKRSHEEVMFYDVLIEFQAKLFELASKNGYASEDFIKTFMYSDYAAKLYCEGGWSPANFDFYTLQMEIIEDDYGVTTDGPVWEEDLMYWIGFIYRYWYFYTGDSAIKIYEIAPPSKMRDMYISYANENPDYIVDVLLGRDPWEPPEVEEDWKDLY